MVIPFVLVFLYYQLLMTAGCLILVTFLVSPTGLFGTRASKMVVFIGASATTAQLVMPIFWPPLATPILLGLAATLSSVWDGFVENRWRATNDQHEKEEIGGINAAIAKDPSNAAAYWARAKLYERQGLWGKAMNDYRRANQLCSITLSDSQYRDVQDDLNARIRAKEAKKTKGFDSGAVNLRLARIGGIYLAAFCPVLIFGPWLYLSLCSVWLFVSWLHFQSTAFADINLPA